MTMNLDRMERPIAVESGTTGGRKDGGRIRMPRLRVGALIARQDLLTIFGPSVSVPDPDQLIHLQFRRFAGCPVCNLHLRSFVLRHKEIVAASIAEIIVFHSTAEELLVYEADLPFDVIADPDRELFARFGVESGVRSLLNPLAWLPVLRAVYRSAWGIVRERRPLPPLKPHGGRFGLPADFLIGRDGRVLACKYGAQAYDQWSVDEVLDLARTCKIQPAS